MRSKWRTLSLLAMAELLAMGVWFSASAVVPALTTRWALDDAGRAWLTMSVQIGFVAGSLLSALLNLADLIPSRRMLPTSAFFAALSTALIPLAASGLEATLPLRFLTGFFLAGVYPVGMKIVATWTQEDRGLGIGFLVGALTIGTAGPHLLNAIGGVGSWEFVLYTSAALAATGGVLAALFVREGPFHLPTPPFNWKYVGEIVRDRDLALANVGYLGHMWELFAMWAWVPLFLMESFTRSGIDPRWAAVAGFATIAIGGLGSIIAGRLADVLGRTIVTISSLVISGSCALVVGLLYAGNPVLLLLICLLWGFAVVADSAQFSAAVSELCRPGYTGTALTLQTSLGFLLTLLTIRLIPTMENMIGWEWSFSVLALGPVAGIWAMASLRRSPGALRMAGGKR
jgi:MFS family permease